MLRKLAQSLLAVGLVVAILLAGCSPHPDQPIRVGTNIWVGYEPLFLARSLKYFDSYEVKLVEYVSNSQSMRNLVDGTIEAAALTLDEALLLQQQGVDVSIVLLMDYSNGADAVIAKPAIKTLADLRGKRVGAETTALGAYMMHRALEKAGLTASDVELVSVDLSQHEQAYLNGEVDAVVSFDPVRSRLLSQGAHVLLDTSELPGEVVDVLVVRNEFLKQHKYHLKLLLAGWFRAVEYIATHPDEAARYMDARMKLGQEGVLNSLAGVTLPDQKENRRLLAGSPSLLSQQSQNLADVMAKSKLLSGQLDAEKIFDPALLQELYP